MRHNIVTGTVTRRQDHTPFSTVARKVAKRVVVIAAVVFAAMLALGFAVQAAEGDTPDKPLPACEWEDGSGQEACFWDASERGNGKGHDVVFYDGRAFTEDPR